MSVNKLDLIIERLDKIIEILEGKKNSEPIITFSKANKNADDSFIKERQKEIFDNFMEDLGKELFKWRKQD